MRVHSTRLPFLRRAVCIDDGPAPDGAFESWTDFLRSDRQGIGRARRCDRCRGRADRSRPGVLLVRLDREAESDRPRAPRRRDSVLALASDLRDRSATCAPGPRTASSGPATSRRRWAPRFAAGGCLVLQRYFEPGEALQAHADRARHLAARLAASMGAPGRRSGRTTRST